MSLTAEAVKRHALVAAEVVALVAFLVLLVIGGICGWLYDQVRLDGKRGS